MPWTPRDAGKHTKKASGQKARRQWSATANAVLRRTGDDAQAIRAANAAISKRSRKMEREDGKV